ncbi:TetR family transcriptional regulator [Jatrophihabitans sp. GAS493]|uniref:TetR/AcrR family transcriptional regulator n=1 Tax=Jatrophihabitans sp. GAS493 TaxID=1907575 RepID=UPI000BB91BFB|nr:TetR/AcrR family transcriptional regulator [Jatrophihabitans sp. GAS493]SOD72222.1 TetR family transcriptional regulator [Jatrophihabitans sp. GAS493]
MTTTLTPKGVATRARIVAGAAAEIRERGLDATTLDDIRARTNTSKSQLFHYFPGGREQLLLAVADHEAARVLDDQRPHLARLTSWASWYAWRDAVVARYRAQGTSCPLSVLMTELGRSTPAARRVTTQLIRQWEAEILAGILALQEDGEVAATLDGPQAARALIAGIQGGVSIMLSTGELTHLEAALDLGIEQLRGRSER